MCFESTVTFRPAPRLSIFDSRHRGRLSAEPCSTRAASRVAMYPLIICQSAERSAFPASSEPRIARKET